MGLQPDRSGPGAFASNLGAALAYAQLGIRVFPNHEIEGDCECSCGKKECSSAGKHPRVRDWQLLATTDANQIRQWWSDWPGANIGIACGAASNLTVLDVDGDEGRATLRELELANGDLPETPIVITGSKGGYHYYFTYEAGLQNAVRFAPGLDIRTEGGLVVGAGSAIKRRYLWDVSFTLSAGFMPSAMPAWLADMIRTAGTCNGNGSSGFSLPGKIPDGQRNNLLYKLGRSLKAKGLSFDAVFAAMQAENKAKCEPPKPDSEIAEIARRTFEQPDQAGFPPISISSRAMAPLKLIVTA